MRAFWSDPYLWVHLAGLAVVPIFLEVCLVGLAMGDPLLPGWAEIVLVAIAGIAPILWMQWQRPFSIYSLVAVALTPSQLTDDQRRILKIFKSQESRILAAIAAVVLFLVLVKLYALSPVATTVAPRWVGGRLTGLLVAAIAFLLTNLFVQVPVSVLRALAVSQTAFAETVPYPSAQVGRDFSLLGIGVKRILPPLIVEPPRPKPAPPPAVNQSSAPLDDVWDEPLAPTAAFSETAVEEASAMIAETIGEVDFEGEAAGDSAIAEPPDDWTDDWEASASVEEVAVREGEFLAADAETQVETQAEPHVEPHELIQPVEPIEPVQPIEPIEPVEPIEPIESVELIESVEPVEPIESVESVESIEPVELTEPVEADLISSGVFVDEPEANASVDEPPPDGSEALEFDELFDQPQGIEAGLESPVEETIDADSFGHDLIPEMDDPIAPEPDPEQQG